MTKIALGEQSNSVINEVRLVPDSQIFRCDTGGPGERHHHSERCSGSATQYVQR